MKLVSGKRPNKETGRLKVPKDFHHNPVPAPSHVGCLLRSESLQQACFSGALRATINECS